LVSLNSRLESNKEEEEEAFQFWRGRKMVPMRSCSPNLSQSKHFTCKGASGFDTYIYILKSVLEGEEDGADEVIFP
jgi:hypothetical protein